MATKKLITISPTKVIRDKKGNPINVYRAGIKDTNKYARKTPSEIRNEENMGNKDYKPTKES